MPSHPKMWQCCRPRRICRQARLMRRHCGMHLSLQTCAMCLVAASNPLLLLAQRTVYGGTWTSKTSFRVSFDTRSTECVERYSSTCILDAAQPPLDLLIISFVYSDRHFIFPFSRTFPATAKNRLDFSFSFEENCLPLERGYDPGERFLSADYGAGTLLRLQVTRLFVERELS